MDFSKVKQKVSQMRFQRLSGAMPKSPPAGWTASGIGGGGYPAHANTSFRLNKNSRTWVSISVLERSSERLIELATLIADPEKLKPNEQVVQLPDRKALLRYDAKKKRWDILYPINGNTAEISVYGENIQPKDLIQGFASLIDVEAMTLALNQ